MLEIYPLLFVGDHKDAHVVLYTDLNSSVHAVLDTTMDLPTKKWHTQKEVTLKKVGFGEGKTMTASKLQKAIDYIQEFRSKTKKVLVHSRNGRNRSVLVVIAYLMMNKEFTWEDAKARVEKTTGSLEFLDEQAESVKKFVERAKAKKIQATAELGSEVKKDAPVV